MGIKNLSKLIGDNAPSSIREQSMENYFGRKVAVDASMSIYQFLIAVRSQGDNSQMLTNENGDVTSHLQGMFYRTIRMLSNGIKPCFVFDGKPPVMKAGELAKRSANREKAAEELKKAEEADNQEDIEKYSKRLTRVSKQENDDCKKLLRLMGVPVVESPGEAEAQCAALNKAGMVYAVATEDLDALTFGAPVLVRHMTFSEARKEPILEFKLADVLSGLNMTMAEFTDLCIMCGCDYTNTIRGIGQHRALELIKKHKTIEEVIKNLDAKYAVPDEFLFAESRALFENPDVADPSTIKLEWTEPDEAGLIQFLVNEKGFNLDRVQGGIKKIISSKEKSSQSRLESFFGNATLVKRKNVEISKGKKGKGGAAAGVLKKGIKK